MNNKDMMSIIYNQLLSNNEISKMTLESSGQHRIKYYDYPDTANQNQVFIIIEPLEPPQSAKSGSDQELSLEFTFQVNCESKLRTEVKRLQYLVKKEMKKLNYGQIAGGLDEYFPDTGHFVDARRYRGTTGLYDTDY